MSALAQELASAVETSGPLLKRYLGGFDDSNATVQTPDLPNHAAWTMGHLAITIHRAAEKIAQQEFPLNWDPELFTFGSVPISDPSRYAPFADLVSRFDSSLQLLAQELRTLNDSELKRPVSWGAGVISVADLAVRMVFHNGTHCGQLADLRRALGMPRVLK